MAHARNANEVVVVTGAAGRIGSAVVPRLRRDGRALRLLDAAHPAEGRAGEWIRCALHDEDALRRACDGAHAVVHLAGIASETAWSDLMAVNIDGTRAVLEAARDGGVRSVMLASSVHAAGFESPPTDRPLPVAAARPDSYYGVSKAAMEALGSVFADRFGMSVVSGRICTFLLAPERGRAEATWFSPDDAARLCEAAIALRDGRHHVVWGVSRNAPGWFDLVAGEAIGFAPEDDASVVLGHGPSTDLDAAEPIGGPSTRQDHPLGG
ncbi:NAD-dependent epimerase/dehydratase family protein [Microbacterium gilvum]|uniref:NAD(P)-dependent oxidoreductase n=1 Tax=Microbacterium gilvum TaxID=1336204 RepID=A0ABP9A9A2_9MICO